MSPGDCPDLKGNVVVDSECQKPDVAGSSVDATQTGRPPKHEEAGPEEWLPPPGQTGDGRTHLNEKFGY